MRLDIHAHLWSTEYLDLLQSFGVREVAEYRQLGAGRTESELSARFALLDAAHIDMQVLSATPLSPHFEDEKTAVDAARRVNDEYAELVQLYPDRFRAIASLPLPHIDASLRELDRTLSQLGMLGACITTSVLGLSIANPLFEPLYQELNRRHSVLAIHPAGRGALSPLIGDYQLTWSIGAPVEDTVAAMHFILNGIPQRFPGMKVIVPHLGGLLPMALERIDQTVVWEAPGTPEKPSRAARRMWYDTVGHDHIPALQAAVATFGAERLLFGTDFPFQPGALFHTTVDYIRRSGLPEQQIAAILDRNAAELFGLADR
ncbi:Predicted metal-dependent hydrolase of the TIM-barrel fold [Serratia entomophila]|uniref:amidohydrolase family protein n=1 Tax=Serratia entomophila TaxID=42906 RepID=UPI002179261A|nr:amidohydrolase family protein [Serratia entomophila]CAI0777819.1 Predicted metal-dependent hydrolase of the TIM-barrel fold [Serratia entomophila]CAI1615529.1 Predicted metal-dependent hydrolase of the TIM-barrel fold [Serratia entomophila]